MSIYKKVSCRFCKKKTPQIVFDVMYQIDTRIPLVYAYCYSCFLNFSRKYCVKVLDFKLETIYCFHTDGDNLSSIIKR